MRNIVVNGLLLPFRLYFQPRAFRAYMVALTPPPAKLGDARAAALYNRRAGTILLQYIVSLIWVPAVLIPAYLITPHALWEHVQISFTLCLVGICLVLSEVVFGNLGTWVFMFGIIVGIVFPITTGLSTIVKTNMVYEIYGQVTPQLATSANLSGMGNSQEIIAFGFFFGIAGAMSAGIVIHPRIIFAVGLVLAVLTGFVSAFGNLSQPMQANVISVLILVLTLSHLLFYPLQFLIGLFTWATVENFPHFASFFWRISPIRWDEFAFLPLPGTVKLIVTMYREDPEWGEVALARLAYHPFYNRIVRKVEQSIEENVPGSDLALRI